MKSTIIISVVVIVLISCVDKPVQPSQNSHFRNAFTYSNSLGTALATVKTDGTDLRTLKRLTGPAFSIQWALDGSKLAFDVDNLSLAVINSDGSQFTILASRPSSPIPGRWYSWFGDSRHIAYSVNDTMYSHDIVTGTRQAIGIGDNPEVSPSGESLAFIRDSLLFFMNIDGSGEQQLADSASGGHRWSPSSLKIAFISLESSVNMVDRFTGTITALSQPGSAIPTFVSWSPDGSRLAYEHVYGISIAKTESFDDQLFAINSSSPAWAPNGSLLAYITTPKAVILQDPSGADSVRVTNLTPDIAVVWSPVPLL